MASPPNSITRGMTLQRCLMYLVHFWTSAIQNDWIPSTSCCLFFGLTTRLKYSFNSCQKFLIGLWSLQVEFSTNWSHCLEGTAQPIWKFAWDRCLALVYENQGRLLSRNGFNECYRICAYIVASILPSKMHRRILLLRLMLPPTHGLSPDAWLCTQRT